MLGIGCDHGGFALMEEVRAHLKKRGTEFKDFGTFGTESVDYPDYAQKVCEAIQKGECDNGILICGTGIGISIAANKMDGIRAALCGDSYSAELTRLHNNANVLCMGGRVIGPDMACKIVDLFLDTPFSEDERHKRRIAKAEALAHVHA